MSSKSKILIIGQAPGLTVHKTGKPWDDKSGENLRNWMGINDKVFYDNKKIGIMPMGFCYPGKGKSGDLPPRKECAPEWHEKLLDKLDTPSLILLIGSYAQNYYLGKKKYKTLTETVKNYHQFLPKYFVLPHPSPRNNIWMKKNPWFKNEVIPTLKNKVLESLSA
ncbi:MAG: uracil-DNA glycosylase family protein [Saprospiraceae bacterium]|nr:uracil-DNA glycosylase family protein [Saprospiraceae bacterium]